MIALFLAFAQQPDAAPQQPQPRGRLLDGIAAQAGDDLVTLSEYERLIERYTEIRPPQSREDEERNRVMAMRDLLTLRLEEQNGKDLGLDPAQIGRMRRGILSEEREKAGLEAYLAKLQAEGKDALAEESDRERAILRWLWEQKALGRPYAAKRATQDETMRPGELREIFVQNIDRLAPVTVQLCLFVVSAERAGSPEAAREACLEARARVEAGEDLSAIVAEEGDAMRETRGLTDHMPLAEFQRLSPELGAFAAQAENGALTEILPLTNLRTKKADPELGYQLVQLRERRTPEKPDFEAREVQHKLNEVFEEQREQALLGRARERLRRESFSWVSPLITGAPPPAPVTAGDKP